MTSGESSDYEARLVKAADAVQASLDVWEDNVEERDAIILEALDRGAEQRTDVARWAGVSRTRVTQIVARRAAEQ